MSQDPAAPPPLLSVTEARARILDALQAVGTELVPLTAAAGRVLRADAVARRTQPPFDASAMDGYAVRAAEAVPGAALRVAAEIPAGAAPPGPLGPGEAMRIFTGAPIPPGADAILLQEDADRAGETVRARETVSAGAWVRPAGGDFAEGAPLLSAPRRLSPEDLALAAAAGLSWLTVSRRPKVALLAIGDELRLPGDPLGPAAIVSSNNFGVAALVEAAGGEPVLSPLLPDDLDALRAALRGARSADVLVTLGGASEGALDLARPAFAAEGVDLDFYRIAMRPGKPLSAGRFPAGGPLALGLPGNPVSAMICARLFLSPAIAALSGAKAPAPVRLALPLAEPIGANARREHYMRGVLVPGPAGPTARPVDDQDSSLLSRLSAAEILILRPPHDPARAAGEAVECIILREELLADTISGVLGPLDTNGERG